MRKRIKRKSEETVQVLRIEDHTITVAIYARKSKYTGKGESVINQIETCKDFVERTYPDKKIEFIVYQDEGYSGATTNRPEMQKMMADIKANKINVLVCYRLDRISRNVSDFSSLVTMLFSMNINFICVKEQFDLTTPMGIAMMNISAVFAQLERDTIAERIRDNMYSLAKTGRWLGGNTPLGFKSEKVIHIDPRTGKQRFSFRLTPIVSEVETVQLIFKLYLQLRSLTAVESYLYDRDIKTRNGVNYSRFAIKGILENPVYAKATLSIYNFLEECGSPIFGDIDTFDGSKGLMVYNKTEQKGKRTVARDMDEWIVALGNHEGIVEDEEWIKVQELLDENKDKGYAGHEPKVEGLLSGLITCKECGSPMIAKASGNKKDGKTCYSYICSTKTLSRRKKCNSQNIPGMPLDEAIINELKKSNKNLSAIFSKIDFKNSLLMVQQEEKKNEISAIELRISKIGKNITEIYNSFADLKAKGLLDEAGEQLDAMRKERSELEEKLNSLKESIHDIKEQVVDVDSVVEMLTQFDKTVWDALPIPVKKEKMKELITKATWNGKYVKLYFFDVPETEDDEDDKDNPYVSCIYLPGRQKRTTSVSCEDSKCYPITKTTFCLRFQIAPQKEYQLNREKEAVKKIDMNTIGGRIKYYRIQKGLLQKTAADMLNIDRKVYIRFESNEYRSYTYETLSKICSGLDINKNLIFTDYYTFIERDPNIIIGEILKSENISIAEFAKKIGVSKSHVYRWKKRIAVPSKKTFDIMNSTFSIHKYF